MKGIFTTAFTVLLTSFAFSQAEQTLVLQPDAAKGKDARVFYLEDQTHATWGKTNDKNYGNSSSFQAAAWTWESIKGKQRSFIEFDLSTIPANAIITKAELDLYHNPNEPTYGHSQLSGTNEVLLQKVT